MSRYTLPSVFQPRLDVLPSAQRRLWPELAGTPQEFTLYGGTAIALRLGHRPSIDFDWFATEPFAPNELMEQVPYLKGAAVRQLSPDTLTVTVDRGEPVQLSFSAASISVRSPRQMSRPGHRSKSDP
jgi:hypothetical protein